mmetsp:Transcript_34420/g.61422  ORF Transcript_34420/g.61422 Transcript_34420/m.61422 type:complete len:218 (+) Transcript_34420:730-1383(+)
MPLHHAHVARAHRDHGPSGFGDRDGMPNARPRVGHLPKVTLDHHNPRAAHRRGGRVFDEVMRGARVAEKRALRVRGGQHHHRARRALGLRLRQEIHASFRNSGAVKLTESVGTDRPSQRHLQRLHPKQLRVRAPQPRQRHQAIGQTAARVNIVGAAVEVGYYGAALFDGNDFTAAMSDARGGQKLVAHGGVKVDDSLAQAQHVPPAPTASAPLILWT